MPMLIREIFDEMAAAFRRRNSRHMRKLNDRIMIETAVEFSKEMYELSVLSYVLGKILSKPRFFSPKYKQNMNAIQNTLELARKAKDPLSLLPTLEREVGRLESEDPRFVIDLFTKGRLKMAAIFYAQGFSLGRASEITGVPKSEILSYAGKTMMFEKVKTEVSVEKRLHFAREALGG